MGGGQRGMSAEIDLDRRGEPAQIEALGARGTNAVSDRFISRATSCIQPSSAGPASTQTAAGLPANGFA